MKSPPVTYLCKDQCTALTSESGPRGSDKPLPPEHLPCVWREFEPYVRRMVVRALFRLPLGKVCASLEASGVAVRRAPALVRYDLVCCGEVQDLVQEIGCAMTCAVHRGGVFAARPAIYSWVRQVVYWLVPDRSRQAAIVGLTGALFTQRPANDNDGDDDAASVLDCVSFGSSDAPEERLQRLEEAKFRFGELTPAQFDVAVLSGRGRSATEIAEELGISEVAVRLRLMHARRRLTK